MAHTFDHAWYGSTIMVDPKSTKANTAQVGQCFAFFTTKITNERDELPE